MNVENYDVEVDEDAIVAEEANKYLINFKKVPRVKFSEVELSYCDVHAFMRPADGVEGYLSAYSEFSFLEYKFQQVNNTFPNVFRFEAIAGNKFVSELFKYHDVPANAYAQYTYQSGDSPKMNGFMIAFAKDLILYFDSENGCALYCDKEYQKDKSGLLYKIFGLLRECRQPKVTKNKIYVVYKTSHGFDKTGFDVKKIKINLEENYNDDFLKISEEIIKGLNDKHKTNLVILSGAPGVGKTYFCRFLTSKLRKNIIFISPDMVESITDPAFIPFLMKNNDSILIIEDAEPALEQRSSGGRSSAVSNVLNLTDGLLSDCLNISIIATFNTTKKTIDSALLRKGRLLMNYKFDKLSIEKSKALLEKLGHHNVEVKEPMTLADIYYYGTDNNATTNDKKIGF